MLYFIFYLSTVGKIFICDNGFIMYWLWLYIQTANSPCFHMTLILLWYKYYKNSTVCCSTVTRVQYSHKANQVPIINKLPMGIQTLEMCLLKNNTAWRHSASSETLQVNIWSASEMWWCNWIKTQNMDMRVRTPQCRQDWTLLSYCNHDKSLLNIFLLSRGWTLSVLDTPWAFINCHHQDKMSALHTSFIIILQADCHAIFWAHSCTQGEESFSF